MIWPLTGYSIGWIPAWVAIAALVVEVVIRLVAIGVIPGGRRPSTAMAWLLGVFLVPVVALPLFAVLGTNRLSRRRQELQREINEELAELLVGTDDGDPCWPTAGGSGDSGHEPQAGGVPSTSATT